MIIVFFKNKKFQNNLYRIRIKITKVDQKHLKTIKERQESVLTQLKVVINLDRNLVKEKKKEVNKVITC